MLYKQSSSAMHDAIPDIPDGIFKTYYKEYLQQDLWKLVLTNINHMALVWT